MDVRMLLQSWAVQESVGWWASGESSEGALKSHKNCKAGRAALVPDLKGSEETNPRAPCPGKQKSLVAWKAAASAYRPGRRVRGRGNICFRLSGSCRTEIWSCA